MTPAEETAGGDHAGGPRAALLASLGLEPDASLAEVDAARDRLIGFLQSAPPELRPWAAQQVAAADAAHRFLAAAPGESATPEEGATLADVVSDDADAHLPLAQHRRGARTPLLLVLVGVGVVLGVYFMGGDSLPADHPDTTSAGQSSTATPALEEERAAELEAAVAADPSDVDARLALGVALFNGSDLAGAEEQWLAAAQLDPQQPEVQYNLGFLYLSRTPPDVEAARAAWGRVTELAPDSELAQTAAAHLERLDTSPTQEPTP